METWHHWLTANDGYVILLLVSHPFLSKLVDTRPEKWMTGF